MFGSDIVDVALGMVCVYLLLSLICSAVKELIEQVMKHRARDMETSLRELLADPDGAGLVQKIYNHGMIFGLFKGAIQPGVVAVGILPAQGLQRNNQKVKLESSCRCAASSSRRFIATRDREGQAATPQDQPKNLPPEPWPEEPRNACRFLVPPILLRFRQQIVGNMHPQRGEELVVRVLEAQLLKHFL
jgi:hypothetical protein